MRVAGKKTSELLDTLRNGDPLSDPDIAVLLRELRWMADFSRAEGMRPMYSYYLGHVSTLESMQDARKRK